MHRKTSLSLLCVFASLGSTARAEPMFTKLSSVHAESSAVVVGVLTRDKVGPVIGVEYSLRGSKAPGVQAIRDSPDRGRTQEIKLFLDFLSPSPVPGRVVAFIDGQNRLRWVGPRISGCERCSS